MNEYSLSAQNIIKTFPGGKTPFLAVNDLSFNLAPGESVAFLGPMGQAKAQPSKFSAVFSPPALGKR